jgi:putative ABC transport system permease protein
VLISALGTITGIALGAFAGLTVILSIDRLSDANIAITIPWLWLILVLVLGILLGFLAALIPAKRSTRLDVLDAIQAV